jgi:hypothetical protein
MPVRINEVNTEVHAFDPTVLLTDGVLRVIVERVAAELERRAAAETGRAKDREIRDGRRRGE